jgi:hypothetical protein
VDVGRSFGETFADANANGCSLGSQQSECSAITLGEFSGLAKALIVL